MSDKIREAFTSQAAFCESSGSPLTAKVLLALADTLDHSTRTGARILDWQGDPLVDALKLRIAGGINALARSGRDPELFLLYEAAEGDFERIIGRILHEYDDWLYPWLDGPPQTNEVMRSAALMPGLMEATARTGLPIELLELGASAGLNHNLDRFAYDLGGRIAGDPASPVRIAPLWSGRPPPDVTPVIVARRAVDH